MSERPKPYIGVTGITTPEQAKATAEAFRQFLPAGGNHIGMTGYLVALENLKHDKYQNDRYPPLRILSDLLSISGETALNTIHYRTPDKSTLADQIIQIFEKDEIYDRGLCRTLQLNVRWPDPKQLTEIRERFPDLQIILQLSQSILKKEHRENVADHINEYKELIDFVLIDPSGGEGREADADLYAHYYRAIDPTAPNKTVILAGGLTEENVTPRLEEIGNLLQTTSFGIDAEKGLRVIRKDSGWSDLSPERVQKYIERAAEYFHTHDTEN